jgi:hypothetical protein
MAAVRLLSFDASVCGGGSNRLIALTRFAFADFSFRPSEVIQ